VFAGSKGIRFPLKHFTILGRSGRSVSFGKNKQTMQTVVVVKKENTVRGCRQHIQEEATIEYRI